MLDAKLIENSPAEVIQKLNKRGGDFTTAINEVVSLNNERKKLIARADELRTAQNAANKEMSRLAKEKQNEELAKKREELKKLSDELKKLEEQSREVEAALETKLLYLPNLPDDSVAIGKDEKDNVIVRKWGEPPKFDFEPRWHDEIGLKLGMMDVERAAKISGARFTLLSGQLAKLERALLTFMLDVHTQEHGFREFATPYIVLRKAMEGTGQLPKFEEEAFKTAGEPELFLIPTAEVPLTNIHAGEIIEADKLPVKYTAFTPCFRREAGSYGKDTRGMIRQHQFDKVELVILSHPEKSFEMLEQLTGYAEKILQKLNLAYRVVLLSTGDMGFSSAKTYDLEVWLPAQNTYREISSCSCFTDFQARRARIRFKDGKANRLVHTLNGSGLAIGRTLVAVLENYQQQDGSVIIPQVLRPYMGGAEKISPQ